MNKNIIFVVALIIGLGGGYLLWGEGTATWQTAWQRGGRMMPGGGMMGRNIDQHFIAQMIPHHEDAIAMARVALLRSKRPELRSLALDIIETQERENADMRSWYQAWFGNAPPAGGMGMAMGSMEGDIDALTTASASEFDREFLEQMIPHHEMAIMMAQMLAAATERPEMRELAGNIIASQTREIELMRSWLDIWY